MDKLPNQVFNELAEGRGRSKNHTSSKRTHNETKPKKGVKIKAKRTRNRSSRKG